MDELFAALKGRDQAAVERILAADPRVASSVDASGVSALLTAAYRGNAAAVAAHRATGIELSVFEAAARSLPTASTRSVSLRSLSTRWS